MQQPPPLPDAPQDSVSVFDWRTTYHALREKLWLIGLCLVASISAAAAYLAHAPVLYGACAVVQVDQLPQRIVNIDTVQQEDLSSEELINTMIQTMTNGGALRRVVEANKFHQDSQFMPMPPSGKNSVEDAVGLLAENVSGSRRKTTRLIDVTAKHTNREIAQRIADAVVAEFVESTYRQRVDAARTANGYLMKEAKRLQEKLTKSEKTVFDFRKDNNAISLSERQDIVTTQLSDANAKLSLSQGDRLRLEADLGKAKTLAGRPNDLIQIPSIAQDGRVIAFKEKIAEKENELSVLAKRYQPKHPTYIATGTELENLKAALEKAVLDAAGQIDKTYLKAKEVEQEFAQALRQQEVKQIALNKLTIEYNILTREMEADRALHESVLARMKEIGLTQNIGNSPIHVVESAVGSGDPVEPNKRKILMAAILGGLIIGIGLAVGLSFLDNTFKTVDDAERTLNLPVLSAIPQSRRQARVEHATLAMVEQPRGMVAETFRSLRASLALLGKEEERRTFLFASAVPREGKSFCAANYAVALAQQGLSTLLIDADMREPVLAKVFTLKEHQTPGLAEFLVGQGGLELAVKTEFSKLDLLLAGAQPPNPAELLANDGFSRLIQEALTKYQRIVVDSAPIIPVSDTLLLAPHVQSICLVVRAGRTPRRAVLRACRALKTIGCKPVGVIFSGVPQDSGSFYYSYNPKNAYGRDGVYGAGALEGREVGAD